MWEKYWVLYLKFSVECSSDNRDGLLPPDCREVRICPQRARWTHFSGKKTNVVFLYNEENFSISLATKTERTAATSWNSWWTGAERPVSSSIDSSIHSNSSMRNKRVCTVGSFENNTRAVPHSIWKCLSHYRNRELHFQRANTFAQISRALFGILE